MARLKQGRSHKQAAVTRHLNRLHIILIEDDRESVKKYVKKAKDAFDVLEEDHYKFHENLSEETDLADSDTWFLKSDYARNVGSARSWKNSLTNNAPPPTPCINMSQ